MPQYQIDYWIGDRGHERPYGDRMGEDGEVIEASTASEALQLCRAVPSDWLFKWYPVNEYATAENPEYAGNPNYSEYFAAERIPNE